MVVPCRLFTRANSAVTLHLALTPQISNNTEKLSVNICWLINSRGNHSKSLALFFNWLLRCSQHPQFFHQRSYKKAHSLKQVYFLWVNFFSYCKHNSINSTTANSFLCLANKSDLGIYCGCRFIFIFYFGEEILQWWDTAFHFSNFSIVFLWVGNIVEGYLV